MLVGHFIEFRRVDCLPVAFEFLWIYLETVDPRYFRRTFYLFLRQKVSFSVGGERVHFLWSNEGVFLMNLSLRNVSEAIGPSQDKLSLSLQGHLLDLLIKRSGSLLLKVQTMTTFPMSLQVLRGPNMLILTLHKPPARLLISLLTSIDISLEQLRQSLILFFIYDIFWTLGQYAILGELIIDFGVVILYVEDLE